MALWILIGLLGWLVLALALGLLIGRTARLLGDDSVAAGPASVVDSRLHSAA